MRKKLCLTVAIISLAACGGSGGMSNSTNPTGPPINNTTPPAGGITVSNDAYSPALKTVAVGTTIEWAWNTCSTDGYGMGTTCVAHSVTFDDGTTSPTQDQGTFSRTFSVAGTYNYHCAVHGAAMTGTITVQ